MQTLAKVVLGVAMCCGGPVASAQEGPPQVVKINAIKNPEIRSPGLPDNVRRLGDLRLECKVGVAIAKKEIPFWLAAAANTVLLTGDWCSKVTGEAKGLSYLSSAELTAAILVQGERKLALTADHRNYTVPIGDRSWEDDALVELSYATQ